MSIESNCVAVGRVGFLLLLAAGSLRAVDVRDTRLLSQPAVSADHVAFTYDNDLWIASRDGSGVRRLTSHEGVERDPQFSPDGSLVAFSGQYDGNIDVFVVPTEGGPPRRLTWHPGPDVAEGFTPDGSSVLFRSSRHVFTGRYVQLFTVGVDGGHPERLPIPNGLRASYSEDGSRIAYIPIPERNFQWKNYRGGTASRIWLYDTSSHAVDEIPRPEGRSNDTDPMWIGAKVYFRSDRAGEINLFVFDPATESVDQLTTFTDFPVLAANNSGSSAGSDIIFEQAGYLHLYDTADGSSRRLRIGVASDLTEVRPRFEEGAEHIRSASLSPSGARAVFEVRGDVVTVPAKKGDPRNLTATTGAHERSPAWSPDGSEIAFFSDESGEYRLHIVSQDGRGTVRKIDLEGEGFYMDPRWSPDGTKIGYVDNSWTLYLLDVETEAISKVASEPYYGPQRTLTPAWSPDSRWLAYTRTTAAYIQRVWLYSLEDERSYAITDSLTEVSEPVFDASGKYLYFLASTDAGPVKQWFAMSNADASVSRGIYLAVLAAGVPSPLAPESDEEGSAEADDSDEPDDDAEDGDEEGAKEDSEKDVPEVEVDFDGLDQRILALPVSAGQLSNLTAGADGKIFYLESAADGDGGRMRSYDLEDRKEETLLEDRVAAFEISADRKKVLYLQGDSWGIADLGPKIKPEDGLLRTDEISIHIDPRAEWRQIFDEAWRINRDYFYDPGMHGADWLAMREKYRPFLDDLATRPDLNRLLQWMSSELAVGHHGVGGGARRTEVERVGGGLLGADFKVVDGRYRFAKVYGGLNWNPQMRSPLTEPGVDVAAGEFLIAVEGRDLDANESVYSRFEATAGKRVEITVAADASGSDSRTVTVVPVASESALRNRDWVEGNLRKVEEATDGRVAYVYVPNTTTRGHEYFKRYFFPQVDREAIIVDERFNGGGQVADYYIDHLRRPFISYWATRYGADISTPGGAILGPKVMLIDETAGSGGDLLPWMFRKLELGLLIGKRTWGGLVGTLGFPILMDGGSITAPNLAIWTEDGFVVENVGVPPDIEVEQWPADVIAGRDPQLEKAIEVVLEALEESPRPKPERPPFPIRVRR